MAFAETPAEFINVDDFGTAGRLNGRDVIVIIDQAVMYSLGMESAAPIAAGTFADLGAAQVGEILEVNGDRFEITNPPQNDGVEGLTVVTLRSA